VFYISPYKAMHNETPPGGTFSERILVHAQNLQTLSQGCMGFLRIWIIGS